jgi:Fe-S-cluster containining protein
MKRSYEVMEYGELFGETHDLLLTEDRRCVFLNDDLSCNVYEDRPWVCKKYGDESCSFMTCPFQSKEGRIRSRQERRKIERENLSDFKKINKLALLEEKKHS